MLWVEQPVGTGFSIGEVTATSEEDIAQDFVKFFKNFQTIFGIKKFKIYVTGESYAGRYVPYISSAMIDEKDTDYFDLSGKVPLSRISSELILAQEHSFTIHVLAPMTTPKRKLSLCHLLKEQTRFSA
jgi:carboxypeptidase C (cathepsin A)